MIGSNEHLQSTAWYETTYMPSPNPNQTITNNNLNIQTNSQQQQQQNLTSSTNSLVRSYVDVVHFNNFGNAIFTLFHLTFLNNWHITAEAAMATVEAKYSGHAKSMSRIAVFVYFVFIFVLGWVLVMNVFISKFLEGYVEAKHAQDERKKRRRLTSVQWVMNESGEKEPISVPMNPDKQVVLDGKRKKKVKNKRKKKVERNCIHTKKNACKIFVLQFVAFFLFHICSNTSVQLTCCFFFFFFFFISL